MTSPVGAANRLASETSPYLLQHATNPVDWWPWSEAALAEAKRLERPILLSVGYAACHWCHVMAHESFEDAETAAVMNALYINIKVDREERPDIDQIYMNALHLLGEQGGWPLTMFLTPAGEPFWGGTYFPKHARYGRPAFVDVLRGIEATYRREPDKISHNTQILLTHLGSNPPGESKTSFDPRRLDIEAGQIVRAIDSAHGGLRVAPKFPQCEMLGFLWRAGLRTGRQEFFDAVTLTLTQMSRGGIYDHLGGGYARYSVDERWLVPHFEKMLYDNAQILELLALAVTRSPNSLFTQRAFETVGWLVREMTTADGAFASSLDADSEGEEGRFYVWSADDIASVLGKEDARFFAAHYDVSAGGNFEGHTILNQLQSRSDDHENGARLAALRAKLFQARERRIRPGLDDKVLADWNGLMIAALAHAAIAFDTEEWLELAERAFAFIAARMTRDNRIGHSWRAGHLLFPGLASDYSAMIRAALALHEATENPVYLARALAWQQALDRHHVDPASGGYFLAADDAAGLVVRLRSTHDDATPNHHGHIAENLVRLAVVTGEDRWRNQADRLFDAMLPAEGESAFQVLSLLNALDLRLHGRECVILGSGETADTLAAAARRQPFTRRIVLRVHDPRDLPAGHPIAAVAQGTGERAAAYVCRNQSCSLPVEDVDALEELIGGDQA